MILIDNNNGCIINTKICNLINSKNIDNNNISLEKSLEKIEIAKKLHKQKIDLKTISAATNLTLDQLKTILDL